MKDLKGLTDGVCELLHLVLDEFSLNVLPLDVVVELLKTPGLFGRQMAAEMLEWTFEVVSENSSRTKWSS